MELEELKQLSTLITKFKDSIYETDSTGSPAVSVNHAANVVSMTKEERHVIVKASEIMGSILSVIDNEGKKSTKALRDLLYAINILGEDEDVTVDGINTIAVYPPIKFTPKGLEHFKYALDAPLLENDSLVVSSPTEEQDEAAWELLSSLAGYCPSSKFKEWFEGDTEKERSYPISKEMDECVNGFMETISEITH